MKKAVLNSLTEEEWLLVASTDKDALAELDEDELLGLHKRARRARAKYVKIYRRQGAAKVGKHGGRGKAYARNQRNRDKVEVFEIALARVSGRLAVVAGEAAAALRSERLEQARRDGSGPSSLTGPKKAPGAPPSTPRRKATKTTGGLKKDASTRAAGQRRQAKRDSRQGSTKQGSG